MFQPAVLISRSLATASNNGDHSASRVWILPSPTLVQNFLSAENTPILKSKLLYDWLFITNQFLLK
jgi:hypothetical protein